MKKLFLTIVFFLFFVGSTMAQCAMCRATLESNVSNGSEQTLSSNLNFGILYLFVAPYLIIAIVAIFWYKNSKPKVDSGQIA